MPYAMESTVEGFDLEDKKGVKFLPKDFSRLFPDLIAIQIRLCSITSIKNHFHGLTKLRFLDLESNLIEKVGSDAFAELSSLEYLALDKNRIQFLAENIFNSQKALKELYLHNNRIQSLHPKIFGSLVKIEKIKLDQNKISVLPENIFENATSLKTMSFTANKLERLSVHLYKNNLQLEKIDFSINNIEFIDATMFDHLQSLESVGLESNACIDASFEKNNIEIMRANLRQNCNENATMETTEIKDKDSSQQATATTKAPEVQQLSGMLRSKVCRLS